MGLEYRKGNCYYTRSYRVNGRVRREHISSGSMALLDAGFDEVERMEALQAKRKAQMQWQEERKAAEALDAIVDSVSDNAVAMFRAAMEAAGFHQHSRGQWRKKRQEAKDEERDQAREHEETVTA